MGGRLTGEVGGRGAWGDWDRRDRERLGVSSEQVCSGGLGRLGFDLLESPEPGLPGSWLSHLPAG